jgi:hypothetical protein
MPGNGDDGAGNPSGLDVSLQRGADPCQPLAGEADVFRLGARQAIIGESGAGSEQAKRGRENSNGSHGRRLPFGLFGPLMFIGEAYGNARGEASGASIRFRGGSLPCSATAFYLHLCCGGVGLPLAVNLPSLMVYSRFWLRL